jgi:hypothetical protein
MTGPENSPGNIRPISVAELLAKNATIGSPPVGGRRRRRRGSSEAVTVADLTGEVPVVAGETTEVADVAEVDEERVDPPVSTDGTEEPAETGPADSDDESDGGAEEMSPDPVIDEDEDALDAALDLHESEVDYDDDTEVADDDKRPSYLRSTQGPLFGGQTVADDLARRGVDVGAEDIDREDVADVAPASKVSTILRGAWVVGQCIIAVAFGAGLFIAFDQLWKWNNIVALVLSVLVILGLVVGVRVVGKTEDIGSTLIAVAVGALVTLGPLALLQSG